MTSPSDFLSRVCPVEFVNQISAKLCVHSVKTIIFVKQNTDRPPRFVTLSDDFRRLKTVVRANNPAFVFVVARQTKKRIGKFIKINAVNVANRTSRKCISGFERVAAVRISVNPHFAALGIGEIFAEINVAFAVNRTRRAKNAARTNQAF